MSPQPPLPAIKIIATEPLVKLADAQSYRIRVLLDKRGETPLHAVAAMRCENRAEVHWLSAGMNSPAEAARLMRAGFIPCVQSGIQVIHELLRSGAATPIHAAS